MTASGFFPGGVWVMPRRVATGSRSLHGATDLQHSDDGALMHAVHGLPTSRDDGQRGHALSGVAGFPVFPRTGEPGTCPDSPLPIRRHHARPVPRTRKERLTKCRNPGFKALPSKGEEKDVKPLPAERIAFRQTR
ncbi:hypothetical protein [Tahibacter aquaticus]|uniref:hypothetical protein n=1 Tax=Tahibacter aquaticus TaxID=520092 RepID=UPI0010608CD3|nr:hypothetical protein [Tahibacter aquaticus]